MPSLRLAVEALGTPEVTSIQPSIILAPPRTPATSAEQCRIIMRDHHLFVDACLRQTVAPERAARAVAGPGTEEALAPGDPQEAQDPSTWALQDVVPGIAMEATQGNPAPGRVLPHRDHRIDAAAFKPAVNPGKGITGIGRVTVSISRSAIARTSST